MPSLEYTDFINFDFSFEESHDKGIYNCSAEHPAMTVVSGAKCSDGIVLIADRKLNKQNYKPDFRDKIFGDIKHYLIGYTGDVNLFDIFRRYTVGDIMIERDTDKRYQVDNLLMKVSETIKRFNSLRCTPFKVLIAAHRGNASVLYHIDTDGRSNEIIEHKSIGSGSIIADKFCSSPERDRITMRDFAKYAFLAIHFMDQYCPALGVGVEQGGVPNIKYLYYDQEWDKEPTKEDINEYREYTSTRLPKIIEGIDSILKQ